MENAQEGQALFNKLNAVVARYLKLPLSYLGAVPEDPQLSKAVMQQMPVSIQDPTAPSAIAYERLAEHLLDKSVAETIPKRGMAAFFSHIITKRKL